MAASNELIEELICDDHFCKYVLDPDEETTQYWDAYRKTHPDRVGELEEARKLILLLGSRRNESDSDERVANIWHKLQNSISIDENVKPAEQASKRWLASAIKMAAVLLLLIGVSYLFIEVSTPQVTNSSYSDNYFQRSTQPGQKATFYLPDGSHVVLNAGSKIEYYECIDCHTRELLLEGEAFFNIKEDIHKPFTVKTKNINTTVLGTSFNVRAYADEESIEVVLISGKVSISDNVTISESPMVLLPNEMASYNRKQKTKTKQPFNAEHKTAWKDKILVFEDADFKELVTTLSRWYGVEFIVRDSARHKSRFMDRRDYKGKYKNKSLETVLEAVSFSYDFEYEINGKKVIIK